MRGLLLSGALLVMGFTGVAVPPASEYEPVGGQWSFQGAALDGVLELTTPAGTLAVNATREAVLRAEHLRVVVVEIDREVVHNPVGKEVVVNAARGGRTYELSDATLTLTGEDADRVLYACGNAISSIALFTMPLGHTVGDPFGLTTEDARFVVTDAGQAYAFEHTVPAPAFGAAHGMPGPSAGTPTEARVQGSFQVVLDHTEARLENATQSFEVSTGEWHTDDTSAGPLTPRYRTHRAYAVVEAAGGSLGVDLAGSDFQLLTDRPSYHFAGQAWFRGARGLLQSGTQTQELRGASVQFNGTMDFQLRARGAARQAAGLLPSDERPGVVTYMAGSPARAWVDGRALVALRPDAGLASASLAAMVVGALASLWVLSKKLLLGFVLPLYARLGPGRLLDNEARRSVYRAIRQRPFIHLRGIERATQLGFGNVVYHASVLKAEGLVASTHVLGREMYFVPSPRFSNDAMRQLALLSHPMRGRIAETLVTSRCATQAELARALQLRRPALSKQLSRLEHAGLVRRVVVQHRRAYGPTRLLEAWMDPVRQRAGA
jgi:predicted transcriptional regulator